MKKLIVLISLNFIFFNANARKVSFSDMVQWTITCCYPTTLGLVKLQNLIGNHLGIENKTRFKVLAPENVQSYVRDELANVLKDSDKLKVYTNLNLDALDYSTNSIDSINIGIDHETRKTRLEILLEKDINNLNEQEQRQLAMINFSLHHEASHIKDNHLLKDVAANLIIPNLNFWGLKKIQSHLEKYLPSKINWLVKIPLTFGLFTLNSALLATYNRRLEQRADDLVANEKKLILGGIDYMHETINEAADGRKKRDDIIKLISDNSTGYKTKVAALVLRCILADIFYSHPDPRVRLAKLQQRLNGLK